jgi:DNA-binding XRE family transcriptional regulator
MQGSVMRTLRLAAGLSQAELAARAGVSRQLVGSVEAGRHLPRVDAALALAAALDVDVAALFATEPPPVDVVSGRLPVDGALVRSGRVGDRRVTAPARVGPDGFDVADAVVEQGRVTGFGPELPGLVVAGCEPGLEVLERLLREAGMGAVAAGGSSATARDALADGRVHAAVVHGPAGEAITVPAGLDVERYGVAQWRVGLAGPPDAGAGWWREALRGRSAVVQREPGAGVQRTFEEAVGRDGGDVPGPRVGTHLEAARRAVLTGMPAVTIEPAALAVGASFHPLDVHTAELWVDRRWATDRVVTSALEVVAGSRFQRRLGAVGGYDLTRCGTRAA